MRLHISLNISRKGLFSALLALVITAAGLSLYLASNNHNPLPTNIKNQLSYKVIYPSKTAQIDPTSYSYHSDSKILSYKINDNGNQVIVTQQPAPEALGSDTQAYYPALGIHPYAQFRTKLGVVALAKFWQSGNLKPLGESGILASAGTLLIAHSEKNLTNAEWKSLFESLKITR